MSIAIRNNAHRSYAIREKDNSPKYVWLREILSYGMFPKVTILETCDVAISSERERYWHDHYSNELSLLNDKRVGAGNPGIGRIDWTEYDFLLGKMTDIALADEIGCERRTVTYRRQVLGILASFDRTNNTLPPDNSEKQRISLPKAILDKLGTMPDHTLADIANVNKSTIARARRFLLIQSYAETTGNDGKVKSGDQLHLGHFKVKPNA